MKKLVWILVVASFASMITVFSVATVAVERYQFYRGYSAGCQTALDITGTIINSNNTTQTCDDVVRAAKEAGAYNKDWSAK